MSKQGQASLSNQSATKVEPTVHGVTPGAASQIGEVVSTKRAAVPYATQGFKAPPLGMQIHNSGSQGRHGG